MLRHVTEIEASVKPWARSRISPLCILQLDLSHPGSKTGTMGSSQSSSGEAEFQRKPKMDEKEPEKTRQTGEDEDDEPDEW